MKSAKPSNFFYLNTYFCSIYVHIAFSFNKDYNVNK